MEAHCHMNHLQLSKHLHTKKGGKGHVVAVNKRKKSADHRNKQSRAQVTPLDRATIKTSTLNQDRNRKPHRKKNRRIPLAPAASMLVQMSFRGNRGYV